MLLLMASCLETDRVTIPQVNDHLYSVPRIMCSKFRRIYYIELKQHNMTIVFGGCIKIMEKEYWRRINLSLVPECRSHKISLQTNNMWFHQNVFLQDLSPSQ